MTFCSELALVLLPGAGVTGAGHQAQLQSMTSQSIVIMQPLEALAQRLGADFPE